MWIIFFWLTVAHAWTDSAESKDWMVVNDTVMGGVSASQVRPHPDGGVTFSGELSLENNGGFASTRTGDVRQDWSHLSALQREVIGAGRTSIATVRVPQRAMRRIYYRQAFETVAGETTTVTLPLADFEAYTFGRRRPSAPSLAQVSSRIGSMGVMLADKQPGAFSLRILSVTGVPGENAEPLSIGSARAALVDAIERGVPLFNQGDADRCADIYATVLTTLLLAAPDQLSDNQREILVVALQESQRAASEEERAWVLRRAIDAVVSGLP